MDVTVNNLQADEKRHCLVLKSVDKNWRGHGGFQYPKQGPVEAPDWDPAPKCGGGLHGWLWGEGDSRIGNIKSPNWLVISVDPETVVDLNGKVKFPRGKVVFSGTREDAVAYIAKRAPAGKAIMFHHVAAGYCGTVRTGDFGTATAGHYGTATAGYCGTATAGAHGTATADHYGTATAGYCGTATVGYCGTATVGYCGTATADHYGTATAGDHGTATAGDHGTATAGNYGTVRTGDFGTATASDHGTAAAGNGGVIMIRSRSKTHGVHVGKIGKGGLKPNTFYRVINGKFVEAK